MTSICLEVMRIDQIFTGDRSIVFSAWSRLSDARSEDGFTLRMEDFTMELQQIMDLYEILSESPISLDEMMEIVGEDSEDREYGPKCKIAFPF